LVFYQCKALRSPTAIRAYRRKLIPAELSDELAGHVDSLRALLGVAVAA
jgi:hypothetical protein